MAEETSQAPLETGARPRLPRTGILDLVTPLESCVQTVAREYDALHMANGQLFTPNGLRNAIKDSASAVRRCLKCLQGSSSTKATAFNEFYSFVVQSKGFGLQMTRFGNLKYVKELRESHFNTFKFLVFTFCAQAHIGQRCPELAQAGFYQVLLHSVHYILEVYHKEEFTMFWSNSYYYLTPQIKGIPPNKAFSKFQFPDQEQDAAWYWDPCTFRI